MPNPELEYEKVGADHSVRHENDGTDEISVTGLSGLLADAQTPLAHIHANVGVIPFGFNLAGQVFNPQ